MVLSNSNLNYAEYEKTLSNWIQLIINKLNTLISKNLVKKEINKDYNKTISDLCDNIANYLNENNIIYDEYYDFRKIKSMIFFTLKNGFNKEEIKILTEIKFKLLYGANMKYNSTFNFKNLPKEFKDKFIEKYSLFTEFFINAKHEYYIIDDKKSKNTKYNYFDLVDEDFLLKYNMGA